MLKHVVFFKFTKDASEAAITEVIKDLRDLPGKISEIKEFMVGRDSLRSERSYDMVLISAFDSLETMNIYQVHPAHQVVVQKLKKICESIPIVDFEY
jgi:hypothetical protein